MTRRADGPPELAGCLLDLLDRRDAQGTVRGDLDEEFERHVLPALGARRARRWYWRQTLASVPRLVGRRFPGFAGGGIPPLGLFADVGRALRSLQRRPGPTAAVGLTFALALGANVSVFSVVYGVLLRALPYADADRVVRIHPDELFYIRLGGAQRFAREAGSFESVVPWGRTIFTFVGEGRGEEARGGIVQWDHFRMLGVEPALGRTFREDDAQESSYGVVVLSHGLWMRRFGGDPAVVGTRVDINGRMRTIIGVMGRGYVPIEPDWEAWAPLPLDPEVVPGVALAVNRRLRPGVAIPQTNVDMRSTLRAMWTEDRFTSTPKELAAVCWFPFATPCSGSVTAAMGLIGGSGGPAPRVANVADLLLTQGGERRGLAGHPARLGARPGGSGPADHQTALTASSDAPSAYRSVGGHLAAWRSTPAPPPVQRHRMGGEVVLFGARWWSPPCSRACSAGTYRAERPRQPRYRRARGSERPGAAQALVAFETALAMVLVAGATLDAPELPRTPARGPRLRSLVGGRRCTWRRRPGATTGPGRSTAAILLDSHRGGCDPHRPVGAGSCLRHHEWRAWMMLRPGAAPVENEENAPSASFRVVLPGYFEALGVRQVQGRSFEEDDDASAPPVTVINETMARAFFPGEDPIGQLLYQGADGTDAYTIVGVVADVHQADLREASYPEAYFPLAQEPFPRMYVLARTDGDVDAVLAAMQRTILSVDDGIVLSRAGLVTDIVAATVADTRILSTLLTLLGLVALLLGAVGTYGVTSHAVSRRMREIGIRMALGAEGSRVAARTVALGMLPVGVGVGVGALASLASGRVLTGLLFGVAPTDSVTLIAVSAILAATALLALTVPAVRASTVDPVRTLRQE